MRQTIGLQLKQKPVPSEEIDFPCFDLKYDFLVRFYIRSSLRLKCFQ